MQSIIYAVSVCIYTMLLYIYYIFVVCAFVRVSSRMCMLDQDGEALCTLGSVKRRCFQSDRGSSYPKGFKRLTFLLNMSLHTALRRPCTKLT